MRSSYMYRLLFRFFFALADPSEFEKHNMEHKAILMDRLSRERGYLVKMIAVRDMTGLGYKHVGSKGVAVMTSVLKMMQGAYPEVIENIFIVNAPWVFSTLWRLVKPFVAPRTIEKVGALPAERGWWAVSMPRAHRRKRSLGALLGRAVCTGKPLCHTPCLMLCPASLTPWPFAD